MPEIQLLVVCCYVFLGLLGFFLGRVVVVINIAFEHESLFWKLVQWFSDFLDYSSCSSLALPLS